MSQTTIYIKKNTDCEQHYKHDKTSGHKMIIILTLPYIRTELRLQPGTQEAPSECKGKLLYVEGAEHWNGLLKRSWGVSCSGDIQNQPGRNPVQPALNQPALAGRLD